MDEFLKALVEEGLVTEDQIMVSAESAKNLGGTVQKVLIDKGFITEEQYLRAVAKKMNTEFVSLSGMAIDPGLLALLPASIARKHRVLPIEKKDGKIVVAVSRPMELKTLEDIKASIHDDIKIVFATDTDLRAAISKCYRGHEVTEAGREGSIEIMTLDDDISMDETPEKLEKVAWGEKVVATVNNIISQAYYDRASDIHIEPSREDVLIRMRIDGFLEEFTRLPRKMLAPLVSRIKIIANMDVAERRVPQDGRIRVKVSGNDIDMRIATYPTMFGEAAAIRLLTKDQVITLERLGFLEDDLKIFLEIIKKPHGIFLVTGPTGSGKSTTLYAALQEMDSKTQHIISIEDPVEHEIPSIDQQQVNVKAGMTFASALRAMLREDPDVIMVGEIRDGETADIALRAAMTGHLVFSTLHANSAIGTIYRLSDLGVEPYLISSTLIGVMAQRLVRRICQNCKVEVEITPEQMKRLQKKPESTKAYKGAGCEKCRKSGYLGRIGLFEIIPINEEIRILVAKMMPEVRIREKAASMGYRALFEDGLEKVKRGLTTVDEVLRVTCE